MVEELKILSFIFLVIIVWSSLAFSTDLVILYSNNTNGNFRKLPLTFKALWRFGEALDSN